jgi:hypothetical protein
MPLIDEVAGELGDNLIEGCVLADALAFVFEPPSGRVELLADSQSRLTEIPIARKTSTDTPRTMPLSDAGLSTGSMKKYIARPALNTVAMSPGQNPPYQAANTTARMNGRNGENSPRTSRS